MIMEREIQLNKDDMQIKIIETERLKVLKLNNENRISRIIFGLDLIKRYLIDGDKLNKRDLAHHLLYSEDYTFFQNVKFIFDLDEKANNTQLEIHAKKKEEEMYSKHYLNKCYFEKMNCFKKCCPSLL